MSAKNKIRGNTAENYVVERCNAHGIPAERAWASDGRAMGLSARDDGTIGGLRWQSKRFKWENVVKWFINNVIDYLSGEQDIVTIYVDRAKGYPRKVYTVMELDTFLEIKAKADANTEDQGRSA